MTEAVIHVKMRGRNHPLSAGAIHVKTRRQTAQDCFYCGLPADCKDHTIPRSKHWVVEGLDRTRKNNLLRRFPSLLVPSCIECNYLLGGKLDLSLSSRKLRAKILLRKKYAEYLVKPLWSEEEIESLGWLLRDMLQDSNLRQLVRMRVSW